jgi:hypothetical protein
MTRMIEQTGAGTLTVTSLGGDIYEWFTGEEGGVAWTVHDDGTLDVSLLSEDGNRLDVAATFATGWSVRWVWTPAPDVPTEHAP